MRHHKFRLAAALITFLIGVSAATLWFASPSPAGRKPRSESTAAPVVQVTTGTPNKSQDAHWVSIYFESINERAAAASLPELRSSNLPAGDLEVRVWVGFGLTELEGFVLKRAGGEWSAIHLDSIHPAQFKRKSQRNLRSPKSGWESCWQRLVEAGILDLPDASDIQCNTLVLDGMSYVVEVNAGGGYRTYLYDNPTYASCNDAKRMLQIGEILASEFGVEEMRIS